MVAACTCRYLWDSCCPVESWDLIFLFLHLVSKHHWLYSLLWLKRLGSVSSFAKVLCSHTYGWFGPLFPLNTVTDHLDSTWLYCSFLMKNVMLCHCYYTFLLLVMHFLAVICSCEYEKIAVYPNACRQKDMTIWGDEALNSKDTYYNK